MHKNVSFHSSFNRLPRFAAVCLIVLGLAASAASAAVTWKNIQFGGFLSQGYLQTDHNNYPVDTTDGSFDFREYGLNASTTIGSHFRLGAQVFGQKLGKYGDDKPILDWAVADYNFRQEFGLRVGRVKYPRSLHSDVLDADVLRPYIFLPQAMYDSRMRDFQASFDGALAYGTIPAGSSSFDYKVYYGDIPMKTDSGVADFFNTGGTLFKNPPGVQQLGLDSVHGATLAWNTPVSGLRFGVYYSALSHLVAAGPFAAIPSFSTSLDLTKVEYKAGSVEYTFGKWTAMAEYALEEGSTVVTLPAFISPPTHGKFGTRNYYVAVSRRLTDKFEVGTYYSHGNNIRPAAGAAPATLKRNDWTVSARYDINEHLLVKLEVHFINGNKDMFNVPEIVNAPGSLKNSMILFAAKTTASF